jgi:hypothetical protein
MNFIRPSTFIDINEYDYIVSIGNKCPTAMILRDLNIYKESFPFDYIPTTPSLILKYLDDQTDFYPKKNTILNKDKVWFGHFDINEKYEETIKTFRRRFDRLFEALRNNKKILFVYTSEADIYNEMNNRYNNNYDDLTRIISYIIDKYDYHTFTVAAIHTNKEFINTRNLINYTITVPEKYLSDDKSTHTSEIWTEYRSILKSLFKEIFLLMRQ